MKQPKIFIVELIIALYLLMHLSTALMLPSQGQARKFQETDYSSSVLFSRENKLSMSSETGENPAPQRLTKKQFLALQNGSDVRGVSVAHERPVTLSPHEAVALGRGFARWLSLQKLRHWQDKDPDPPKKPEDHLRVSVGMDPRITSESISEALCQGLMAEGAEVKHFGLASTPAMFKSCITPGFDFDAGIMVTASHLPFDRNGMKMFTKEGGMNKSTLKEVMDIAAEVYELQHDEILYSTLKPGKMDFLDEYKKQLVLKIRKDLDLPGDEYLQPLKGFKILVNAGNGAGGFFIDILEELGADTEGSLNLDPDGMFPNHVPNPEDKEAMDNTIHAVKEHQADLGIVFDTDVDRCGVVDASGLVINRNRLIALLSRIVLRDYPGSTIVTDSVTSNGLKTFIESLGGKHLRYMKGYKNVIDKSIELNNEGIHSDMAIETSGHCAFKENNFLDDGAYLVVKVIIEMAKLQKDGKKLTYLFEDLQEPAESHEFRFVVAPDYEERTTEITAEFAENLEKICIKLKEWEPEKMNYEGFRVSVDEGDGRFGWVMVRQSLHEPKVICNMESETRGGLKKIGDILLSEFLNEMSEKLDFTCLTDHCIAEE
mmetsp:Transcript_12649/g.16453  ORF Transcript_12649/g.16453 Transcript_12649/m.16453 type:complete len:601 (+) Transcript_12649:171-1973(+)